MTPFERMLVVLAHGEDLFSPLYQISFVFATLPKDQRGVGSPGLFVFVRVAVPFSNA